MNSKQLQARNNLVHYMRLIAKNSGVGWDYDNDIEVSGIVDLIIEAAVEEATKKVMRLIPSNLQE